MVQLPGFAAELSGRNFNQLVVTFQGSTNAVSAKGKLHSELAASTISKESVLSLWQL